MFGDEALRRGARDQCPRWKRETQGENDEETPEGEQFEGRRRKCLMGRDVDLYQRLWHGEPWKSALACYVSQSHVSQRWGVVCG